MNSIWYVIVILMPIVLAVPIVLLPFKKRWDMELYIEAVVVMTSIVTFLIIFNRPGTLELIHFSDKVSFTLQLDGLGSIFAGLIAILWPIATLYAFEYMSHEERERPFFMFYTMTFGVTLGITLAGNLVSMYFFYEMLTLMTIPLVVHPFTREAVLATRKYIYFSMGGAALGFVGVAYLAFVGDGTGFVLGGVLGNIVGSLNMNVLLIVYVVAFLGFSVKTAMFPFYSWLPDAGVAPTPVTALLHAVAVVNAGVFACARLTYYCFGADLLAGTPAQAVLMILTMFTIVFGCSMAVKETHIKRRLAYSTVSNLSYMLFGVTMMSPMGLFAALCHMVFHAIMKISAFFCAGAIMHQGDVEYIYQTDGFGRKMPGVYTALTIAELGLMGVPGTVGFLSKYYLAEAAIEEGSALSIIGIGCLLVSALLTAIYMMTMVIRGFFPGKDFDMSAIAEVRDPSWQMLVPLAIFSIAIIVLGFWAEPLTNLLQQVAFGLF